MEQLQWPQVVHEIKAARRISENDVLHLRKFIYGGLRVNKEQLDTLFDLDHACPAKVHEWVDFFAEVAAACIVEQQEPYGYIDEVNADWLIAHITRDGQLDSATELEVLIKVLEKSRKSPERLVRFGLLAVKDTILNGNGPARGGGAYKLGVVTEADVRLLRRILFAYGGDHNISVSRAEAEIIFDINDATVEAENHPAWSDLFTKAIANCVLAYSGYIVPTRQEALRRKRWLDEPTSISSFFSQMVSGLSEVFTLYRGPVNATSQPVSAWTDSKINEARRVTEEEANWLASRLGRDGKLHENESALLSFLRERALEIHPALQTALRAR